MDDLDAVMPSGWREPGLGARAAPASSELAGPVALVTIVLLAATTLWRLDRRGPLWIVLLAATTLWRLDRRGPLWMAFSALSSYLQHRQEAHA